MADNYLVVFGEEVPPSICETRVKANFEFYLKLAERTYIVHHKSRPEASSVCMCLGFCATGSHGLVVRMDHYNGWQEGDTWKNLNDWKAGNYPEPEPEEVVEKKKVGKLRSLFGIKPK